MTIAEWRTKTYEGGFTDQKNAAGFPMSLHELLLSPAAWKAVGKVEGWYEQYAYPYWMHRMIDALADGKTIEEYLATL